MKYGFIKSNIKKSIKAKTTGKMKRQIKKSVNPLYGKKGMGIINNPKKSAYSAVYNRTTFGISDIKKSASKSKKNISSEHSAISNMEFSSDIPDITNQEPPMSKESAKSSSIFYTILGIIVIILAILLSSNRSVLDIFCLVLGLLCLLVGRILIKKYT